MKTLLFQLIFLFLILVERGWAAEACKDLFGEDALRSKAVVFEVQSAVEVLEHLEQHLDVYGFNHPTVLLRSFDSDRLAHLLEYGTDRDNRSEVYNIPVADASEALRAQYGILPGQVSFMFEVTTDQWMTVPRQIVSVSYAEKLAQFDEQLYDCYAIAAYDPRGLKRVSEVEYWFLGDPMESLLAVFVNDCH